MAVGAALWKHPYRLLYPPDSISESGLTDQLYVYHKQYCILLEQDQRKAYKPSLQWGRVHPESASGPKITEENLENQ